MNFFLRLRKLIHELEELVGIFFRQDASTETIIVHVTQHRTDARQHRLS
jgi:hypothetical protein